ncbi:uncharacterized protein LOC113508958 [Trichoplusia ni]|uniref:Uncharacterized protein LOC113508958 n=1 Tax=Trichoplusia ni TaxID=7111 RepID=A0A7E5X443_TRINI|nr:uncharacterized protein LOC113508958 [Trichoplusia ni]
MTVRVKTAKTSHQIKETINTPKRDNPNFVRDRKLDRLWNKPQMPQPWTSRFRLPFDPAWMDYCDPYHCNDYYKTACGLNRYNMKFRYFQSTCHLILNNQCAYYRGNLKYDSISLHFCRAYIMFLRGGCPSQCEDEVDPVCGMSLVDGHVVIFKNACALETFNCRNSTLQEYESVYMEVCQFYRGKDDD